MSKSILVPHDFTNLGDYALEHAFVISKISNNPIHLIHIVRKDREILDAKNKLLSIITDFKKANKTDIEIFYEVRKGRLSKEIFKYGIEIDAAIAIMGTYGAKSISKAMKVVKRFVKIPFILVQSPVMDSAYDKIIVPVDSDIGSRIKIQWVRYFNTLFKSKAFIISFNLSDSFRSQTVKNNIKFAEDRFDAELIDYEVNILESNKGFSDEIFNYAHKVDSNLIIIMTDRYRQYIKSLKNPGNVELYSKVPIMCVNKRTDIYRVGGFN